MVDNGIWRIPLNEEYAAAIGRAVYVFSYLEWRVIALTMKLDPGGFDPNLLNGTATPIAAALKAAVKRRKDFLSQDHLERANAAYRLFFKLIPHRDDLLHSHPLQFGEGEVLLGRFGKVADTVQWSLELIENRTREFENAAIDLRALYSEIEAGPFVNNGAWTDAKVE